jgi:hypothetical protein
VYRGGEGGGDAVDSLTHYNYIIECVGRIHATLYWSIRFNDPVT